MPLNAALQNDSTKFVPVKEMLIWQQEIFIHIYIYIYKNIIQCKTAQASVVVVVEAGTTEV